MKICHVGHGRVEIPTIGHGAVESLIWDYKFHCEQLGYSFSIVNSPLIEIAARQIAEIAPDVLHLHDERKIALFRLCDSKIKIVMSHDPILFSKPPLHFQKFEGDFLIGCLSDVYLERFKAFGIDRNRLLLFPNGARSDLIRFSESGNGKCVCLAAVSSRKRQDFLRHIDCVECVSEWSKADVHSRLTEFSASILPSVDEAAPLAIVESLMAGLPVLVSEAAAANLDRSKPFVRVLTENEIRNPFLLNSIVCNFLRFVENMPTLRKQARAYAVERFDWSRLVSDYCKRLNELVA